MQLYLHASQSILVVREFLIAFFFFKFFFRIAILLFTRARFILGDGDCTVVIIISDKLKTDNLCGEINSSAGYSVAIYFGHGT